MRTEQPWECAADHRGEHRQQQRKLHSGDTAAAKAEFCSKSVPSCHCLYPSLSNPRGFMGRFIPHNSRNATNIRFLQKVLNCAKNITVFL
jgi:hypothetical protein